MLKINNFMMTNSSPLFQTSPINVFSIIFQHYRDCQERRQKYNQNLVQIMTVVSITFSWVTYLFLNKLLTHPTMAKVFSLAFTGLILVVISRFIPQLLSVVVVLLTISAPLIIPEFQNNIFVSFILTSLGPLFTLIMTSSHKCFVTSIFIYLIDFNRKFKGELIKKLADFEDTDPDFLEKAFAAVSIQIIISMLIYAAMDYTSQKCMTEILQKEETLERIKNENFRLFEDIYTQISDPLKNLYATIDFYVTQHTTNQVLNSLKSVQTSIKLFRNELENVITHEKMKSQDLETQPMATRTYDWISEIWIIATDLLKEKGPIGFLKIQRKVPSLLYLDSVKIQQIILNLLQYTIEKTKKGIVNLTIEWLDSETISDKSFEPLPYNYEEEGIFEKKEALHFLDKSNSEKNQEKYQVFRNFDREANFENCNYSQKISFGTLKCTIWNTSPGLSEKEVANLFDEDNEVPLSADAQTKQLNNRPLKISREICRRMDGDIRVYSKENVGTTFIACFPIPVYNGPEMPLNIRSKIIKLRKKQLSVMLGHNDLTFSYQVNNYLKSLEANVEDEAGKGSEFFTKLIDLVEIRKAVDLMVIDLSMSHIDVAMFCERLRNHEKKSQLGKMYVILTGTTEKDAVINNLLNKNHPGYINKYLKRPFEFYDFLEALADIC